MNETKQTQINLGDYNKPQEHTKAIGIGKISFFVTPSIVKQIQRVPNYQAELASGKVFGPCKVGQKKSSKTSANYWCLLFPGEEGY